MNHFIHGVSRAVAESFALPEPILEIGSRRVPGQEDVADLRSFFPGKEYIGLDIQHGNGVDVVGSVEDLPFEDGTIGAVVAMNTFEHVARFWLGFDEIRRVLRPDGAFLLSVPFYFHIHNHPSDYWRFTPESLGVLLEDYPSRILGWQGHINKPLHVWALAFRSANAIDRDDFNQYQRLLGRYAKEPLRWLPLLRYRIGRVLCGRRPFIPYLDRNKWGTVCLPSFCEETKHHGRSRQQTHMRATDREPAPLNR